MRRVAALLAACALAAAWASPRPLLAAVNPPVASPPAPAPTAQGPRLALSLADAVFIALRDNRTVQSAYIARTAQKFDLFVAKTRFRPSAILSASVEASRDGAVAGSNSAVTPTASWLAPTGAKFQFGWSRLETRAGGATQTSDVASLSLVQPLLRGAGLAVNEAPVRIAEQQETINRLNLKATVIDTVTAVVFAYRGLLQAQSQLTIAQQSLARARDQLATNQALITAGRMAAAEIVQTRADIANQQVSLLQAEQQRNSAQLALLRLLAMDLHTDIVAGDPLSADHVPIDLDRAIASALDTRPDYLSQRQALAQARQNLIVAHNNRLWTLSVIASAQSQASASTGSALAAAPALGGGAVPTPGLPRNSGVVGLQLSIPLGDYSLEQGEVQARVNLRTQEVQLEDLRQQVESQVRDSVQGVEMAWRQVEAAREARDLAAQTLELEKARLQVGRASNFEVLSFEANLHAADSQALNATIAYLNALTSLDQQLGATLDTWKVQLRD